MIPIIRYEEISRERILSRTGERTDVADGVAEIIREYQQSEGVRLQAVPARYRVD